MSSLTPSGLPRGVPESKYDFLVVVNPDALARLDSRPPNSTSKAVPSPGEKNVDNRTGSSLAGGILPAESPERGGDCAGETQRARRIPVRVAVIFAIVFLNSFCISFLHELSSAKNVPHPVTSAGASNPTGLFDEAAAEVTANPPEPAPSISDSEKTIFADGVNASHARIQALEPSWLTATVDGKETVAKLLDKGETREFAFSQVMRVRLGNAGGVEITSNGNSIGPIGQSGAVRVVELTPTGFRILPWRRADPE